jgi:hypothetical protein
MDYLEIISPSLLRNIPELLAWGFGIFLAVIMVKRGGGKAEKLLLAGCSLMFLRQLASPLLQGLMQLLVSEQGRSYIDIARTIGLTVSLPMGILGLAGFVCLVLAFWMKFWARRPALT